MKKFILYTTTYCHLCEQAEAILLHLKDQYAIEWIAKEISEDDQLIEQYGIRIPVIKDSDNQTELNWPFTKDDIVKLIDV